MATISLTMTVELEGSTLVIENTSTGITTETFDLTITHKDEIVYSLLNSSSLAYSWPVKEDGYYLITLKQYGITNEITSNKFILYYSYDCLNKELIKVMSSCGMCIDISDWSELYCRIKGASLLYCQGAITDAQCAVDNIQNICDEIKQKSC